MISVDLEVLLTCQPGEDNVTSDESIKKRVREYIVDEFLPGESPDALTDSTPLITSGVLDSIGTIKLVTFLEENYHIELEAHDMGPDHLDDLTRIATIVQSKLAART